MSDDLQSFSSMEWLLSFADWERGIGGIPASNPGETWNLGRTRALLDMAGSPDRHPRKITIAGTNGKGSTGAILGAILTAAGLRVGIYSQPHLHDYRERISINGIPIAPAVFARMINQLRPLVHEFCDSHPEAGEPTTFEITTVLAALAFHDANVDAKIFEVGLGGRLDAVNAMDPDLVLITSIGYDHTAILGKTLGAIAGEKAGIFRAGVIALSAIQRPTVARSLQTAARQLGTPLRFVPPLALAPDKKTSAAGQPVTFTAEGRSHATSLRLLGEHQRQNAGLAIDAAESLAAQSGWTITPAAIATALASVRWPGRMEWIDTDPPLLLDGAHNPLGGLALATALTDLAPDRTIYLIFGCAQDKDAAGILRPLIPHVGHIWTVAALDPRAASAQRLAAIAQGLGSHAVAALSVRDALDQAWLAVGGNDGALIVVTGSLRVVAEARHIVATTRPMST